MMPRRFTSRFKYVSSNLGFGRQNRTAILASTRFAFEQLIQNQSGFENPCSGNPQLANAL
jgi:hypothetical protein